MKNVLFSALAISLATVSQAQDCADLFISEYVEGWSNNKAIELYNPTANPIDLSAYRLERYSNGSTTAQNNQRLDLSGTIEPYDVFVIVIDKRDPDGTGQEAPVWDELQAVADAFECPIYDENNAMYFNGNDALVLRKINGNQVIDTFGKIGEDPGNPTDGGGWNNVPPSFAWSLNGEIAWTTDHNMIRKSTVLSGDINPIDAFNTEVQWDSIPANTFENLGFHICDCNVNSVDESGGIEFSVYPNPSEDGSITLNSATEIRRVLITAMNGRRIADERGNFQSGIRFDIADQPAGIYLVQVWDLNGNTDRRRIVLK